MLSELFLNMSLLGAEWVLWLLVFLSVYSIALMIERYRFYKDASKEIEAFRTTVRKAASDQEWKKIADQSSTRAHKNLNKAPDFESGLTSALADYHLNEKGEKSPEVLAEVAFDSISRTKVKWEKNLSTLATIGSNAPFIGLFGTVLGIIQAFTDLSSSAGAAGTAKISSGLSDALIATAVGILVAIPALVAFNGFQRKVKSALAEAEALKSFLIARLAGR